MDDLRSADAESELSKRRLLEDSEKLNKGAREFVAAVNEALQEPNNQAKRAKVEAKVRHRYLSIELHVHPFSAERIAKGCSRRR